MVIKIGEEEVSQAPQLLRAAFGYDMGWSFD
jgi:hypothetical protein